MFESQFEESWLSEQQYNIETPLTEEAMAARLLMKAKRSKLMAVERCLRF